MEQLWDSFDNKCLPRDNFGCICKKIWCVRDLGWLKNSLKRVFIEITHTDLILWVLDFGFLCDELVQHILRSDWFYTWYILAGIFGTQYILSGTYGKYYILASKYVTYYIQRGAQVHNWLYYIYLSTDFEITVSDFIIACSKNILLVFVVR